MKVVPNGFKDSKTYILDLLKKGMESKVKSNLISEDEIPKYVERLKTELELIAENLGYDDEFSEVIQFDNANYLSSTQLKNKKHKINYAWSVNLIEGYTMSSYKSNKQKIRAVRAF